MQYPLVSIITINLNNAPGLKNTIESVLAQSSVNFEYIIIDGGSTDNSLDIIKSYSNKISYWISEKDNGIFNAMNKGIQASKGDYLLFLNSGDYLVDSYIIDSILSELNSYDIIYGDLNIIENNKTWIKKYNKTINFSYFLHDTLPHQACFISREILVKCGGGYNENYNLAGDWKFFIDAVCKYDAKLNYVDKVITNYNLFGLSSLDKNRNLLSEEKHSIIKNEYNRFIDISDEFKMVFEAIKNYQKIKKSSVLKIMIQIRNILSKDKINLV